MFEEMLGALMAMIFRFKGVGGCRWLMFEEVLGAFTASIFFALRGWGLGGWGGGLDG